MKKIKDIIDFFKVPEKTYDNEIPWIYYRDNGGMGVDFSHPEMIKKVNETIAKFMELDKKGVFK